MSNHTGAAAGVKRPREDDSDGEKSDSELQVVVDDDNTEPASPAGSSHSSSYDRERHHPSVKRERASTPSSVKSGSVSSTCTLCIHVTTHTYVRTCWCVLVSECTM